MAVSGLTWLTASGQAELQVHDVQDISLTVKAFDARPWRRLQSSADLMPCNASLPYLELEREQGQINPGRNFLVRTL